MPLRLSASARLKLTTASVALLALAAPGLAHAQVLSGTVKDSSGEARFEGAIVTIEELGRSVATDRFGEFRITNIPAGSYTITTDYVGTPSVTSEIDLPSEGANIDIVIGEDVEFVDNIIVVGTRAAQAGAINQQRASNSIITVIDSDGLGNFPDTTVADSLQRAVGISIETDQGEGRYVSIRGISPDLISASINGVRTPSPEDRRGVLLDGVPSDLLSGIEIQKSLTPDLDADTIGGVINLKTLSAFDRDGQFLSMKAQGRINEITDNLSGKGTLTYTNTWDDRIGLAVSANYQQLAIESHNNEVGGWGEEGGIFYINDDYEHRWYDLTRERIGLVGNLDFRATENTTLYFRSLFNRYEDDEIRNKFEFRAFDDTFDDAFGNGDEDTELASPRSPTQSRVALNEVDAEARKRLEIREIQTYSLGGETVMDEWTFDYEVAYATAEEDDSRNHDVTFRTEDIQEALGATAASPEFLLINTERPETPVLTNDRIFGLILDPANYALDELEEEDTINEDEEFSGQLNIARDSILGDFPVTWKAGGKFRDREKIRDVNKIFSEADDVFASEFTDNLLIPGWRLPNPAAAFPDGDLTTALRNGGDPRLEVNEGDTFLESNFEDFTINEQILAAYAMGTFEIDNLTLVAGVRLEQTDVELQGNIVADEFEDANGNDVPASSTAFTLGRTSV
ncbi:MAG: TonB-dependent receptor [Pseudomonadota bacterium]